MELKKEEGVRGRKRPVKGEYIMEECKKAKTIYSQAAAGPAR